MLKPLARYLALLVMTSPGLARPDCPAEPTRKWDLWAQGTCLRGANIWQKRIDPEIDGDSLGEGTIGPPFVQNDFDRLAALGANYVNFSVPGLFSEYPPYAVDQDVLQALDLNLELARRAGLFVVISFRTGPGRNEAGFDASEKERALHQIWKSAEAQVAWANMWKVAAQRYKNFPHVVGFDLMVEPNANEVWLSQWDPQTFYSKYADSLYDWNPLAEKIIRAIRSVDGETPILVGAMNYSDLSWLSALKTPALPYVVHTIHQYAPYPYTHQLARLSYPGTFDGDEDGVTERIDAAWLDRLLAPADVEKARGKVLAANEFGVMRWARGADRYLKDSAASLEKRGMNHALWLWEPEFQLGYDHFDFRKGPSKTNHLDVNSSALINAIKEVWSRNRLRPGKFNFRKGSGSAFPSLETAR